MRIYLDNCCFNRPYDNQSQLRISLETQAKLYIQGLIRDKKIELATSYILRYENDRNPYEMRQKAIARFIKSYTTIYIDHDKQTMVSNLAKAIMATGVKEKDAIHVACAIAANCDYFLTTDMRLLKYKSKEIVLENPVDFICRLEGEQDG